MMNYIFAGMVLFSFVFAALTGRMDKLSEAAMTQAGQAVTLLLSLMGMMCMWNGLMRVAQASGLDQTPEPASFTCYKAFVSWT